MKATRAAAALYLVLGLGFGAGSTWTLIHFASTGALPMTPFGFRSLAGPFEVHALHELTTALLAEQNERLRVIRDDVLALAKALSPDQLAAMERREVAEPKLGLRKR